MNNYTNDENDQGRRVIGRMTSEGGYRVEIVELWNDDDKYYEVHINSRRVYSDYDEGDKARAIRVARWWMDGCPA